MDNTDDSCIDDSLLTEGFDQLHFPLPLMAPLYGQLLILISLVAGGFLVPAFFQNEEKFTTDTFSALVYLQLVSWVLVLFLTWHIKAEHKISRVLGYHDFYNSTRYLHRPVFYLLTGGTVLMLFVSCVTRNFCLGGAMSPCGMSISLTPVAYLQIIIVIEVVLALPLLIKHLVEVYRFNLAQSPPDVFRGHATHQIEEREIVIGMRGNENLTRLLDHQADQLLTLNHRNEILCQQLYALAQRQTA